MEENFPHYFFEESHKYSILGTGNTSTNVYHLTSTSPVPVTLLDTFGERKKHHPGKTNEAQRNILLQYCAWITTFLSLGFPMVFHLTAPAGRSP